MSGSRRPNDLYRTPVWAVHQLLEAVSIEGTVLEPCAGDGRIANVLRLDARREVYTNDVDGRFDCDYAFDARHPGMWEAVSREAGGKVDWVVSNPPFSFADQIVPLAFRESGIGVAMLLRLTWLEPTLARGEFLAEHPPKVISIPRISFTGDGNTDNVPTAWFVWEHDRRVEDVIVVPRRAASSQLVLEGAV